MKTPYKLLLTFCVPGTALLDASAQSNSWSPNYNSPASITPDKAVARQSFPKAFKLFNLDIEPLRGQLFSIVDGNALPLSTVIFLPNADGAYEQFQVFEASNFEPALQAQFPEIRAYSGKGITDKNATLKLSISPQGIQTMVFRTDKETEFIEPYSADHTIYAVFRSQRATRKLPWTCSTEDQQIAARIDSQLSPGNIPLSNTGELKTMRLAQSCNGEYSNFFGAFNAGQVALVLAAYNATLTRCNGCYEKDLAIHLNLIATTTAVIYYDPATDPYTNLGSWNSQLQTTLTANIGEANYDIGHMFGASGGGGNAGCIGCVCVNGQKGRGITSPADAIPMGDNFDIDYVAHEVGHQMGANHTFSHSSEGSGVNKEVGAGITIMGYAGITSQDPAPHSIDIFHQASIQQIQANMATKTCPITTVMTANHPPVVAPVGNFTIPITTPFTLTGSATDPEGDPITYCWEQNDNSTTTGNASVASPTKLTGPNWLSFSPTASPTRMFPRLSTVLAGLFVTPPFPGGDAVCNIEALSSVSRALNFRLTVRDNRPYVPAATIGQTQFTDMTVTVTNTSGPFKVTAPNTTVSIPAFTNFTVTWNVTNTTLPPVSAANVKISLSTDGGSTFPTILLASTPNDGSESVSIPNTPTTTARIKIEAVGNIFFDISDTNFTIAPGGTPTPPPTVSISGTVVYCSNPSLNAVPGVTMTLTGSASGSTSSDGSGNYIFAGLTSGGSYTITPGRTALTPGSANINTVDVLAVQRHFLLITPIGAGCRLTAADVNSDTAVSTIDVVAVQRFFLSFSTGIADVGKYIFSPANRSYPAVSVSQTAQNYDALVLGDVASGFVHRSNGSSQDAARDGAPEVQSTVATVSLPEVAATQSRSNITAAVTSSMIDGNNRLVGFQGDFTFDERVVTFQSEPVRKAGLTAGNWNVSGNVLEGLGPIRTLRVSAYSLDFTPLSGSGTLFELRMRTVSDSALRTPHSAFPLLWSPAPDNFIFIDADLRTQNPSTAAPGSVTQAGTRR